MVQLALWIPQISCVYLFIVLICEFYFLMLSWLAHINPGRLGRSVGHDDQAQCAHSSSPSCRQLLTAFLEKVLRTIHLLIVQVRKQRHEEMEYFSISALSWSQTIFGSKYGLHPMPFSSTTCTWHNVFFTHLFSTILSPLRAKTTLSTTSNDTVISWSLQKTLEWSIYFAFQNLKSNQQLLYNLF